ncbi:MAG: hypothetical protein NTU97_00620, partial [Candidatus Magasanikbacteria bacterium]|nr:hypothetical protein [Candidatus Magasanikbacteria bacterium]
MTMVFSLATSSGSGGPKGTVLNLGNKDVSDGEGVILLHGGGALVVADQSETYSNVELGVQNNTQGYLRLVNNGTGVTSTLTADALMLGVTTDVNEEIVDNGKFFVYATTGNISTSGTIQSFMPTGVGTTIYAQKWFDIGGNELASLSTTTLGGDFVNLSVGNTALNSSGRLVLKQGSSLYPPQVKVEGATALSYGLLSPSQLTINDGIASGFLNPSAVVVNNGTYFSNLSPQSLTVGGFGTTGGVFGTLKFYGAATLLDALIATSNTSSLRSIKLSSLTSAPDSSAGNIYFDSVVCKFYGYTSAGNVVDLGATGSGVNDWGRFGTTYGALALMTSSTYPVWFDGAIFASSTMNLSNNLTIDRNSYAINDGSPAFVLISGTPSTLDGQYSALALGSASSTNASINGKLWSLSSNSEGGAATTVFALSFSDDATAYSATPMMVTEAGNISLTTTTISTLLSVGTGSNFSYLYPTSLTISRDTGRETGVFYVNGAGEVFASNTLSVNLGSPSSAGLVVKGNALQTGNLLDLKNDLGNSLFSVASSSIFGAPVVDFSVGGAGKLAYVSLKGSGDIGGNAPVFQLMDPSNSYARLSMSTIQTGGSLFTIGTGLATSTFTPTSLRLGQTDVSPYQVGDTGRIFLDGITGSLSASGTLKFYGAATLLDALIATSNTSSLRSIKLSSLTSAPDSSAG